MPTLRPRKRASASSSRPPSSWSVTTTVPESGRSRPAMTISRVDFPDPEGPTMPIASPRPILRSMSLRIWTRAAPRPSDKFTLVSAIAGAPMRSKPAVSFMQWVRHSLVPCSLVGRGRLRSYGSWRGLVQTFALAAAFAAFLAGVIGGTGATQGAANDAAADRPVTIVALGGSLTAGHGLPASAAFPAKLQAALEARGHAVEIVNAGVSGDTAT